MLRSASARGPTPITNLPVNALTGDTDPTQEIRNLINELQAAARDAKSRAGLVEQERDDLATQLENAMAQLSELREKEREFRQQFVEISSLLKDRDAALEAAERNSRRAQEAERKFDAVSRERNDAQRQRDEALRLREEAMRRREEGTRLAQENANQLADVQRQIISIRQARDAAQAQALELNTKLQHVQDEIAELTYARDAAQQAAKKAEEDVASLRRQAEAANLERDATAKQVSQLITELDEQRKKILDLAEQKSQVAQSDSAHAMALAEARQQVLSLSEERDAARARANDQMAEIDDLRLQLEKVRDEVGQQALDIAEREELKRQIAEMTSNRDSHLEREKEFLAETISQQERLAQLTEQLAAAQRGREEALTSLTAAQKQIDAIIRDRDQVRQQGIDNSLEIDTQMAALRAEMAAFERKSAEADKRLANVEREREIALDKVAQAEKQRLMAIDLATQLDNAKRDLLNLSADLAEARLQARYAQAQSRAAVAQQAPQSAAAAPAPMPTDEFTIELTPQVDPASGEVPPPVEEQPVDEPLTEKDAKSSLAAMKHCYQSFTKDPSDLSLLNELHCHVHCFAERARVSGFVALHRLGSAFAYFVDELYKFPELLNNSTMRTLTQTVDFLGVLIKQRDYAALKDPAKALVYAVDDDADNVEAIKLAMETAMLQTHTTQEPAIALAELASSRFDLIFLDVNLGQIDGFELCQQIRQLAIHSRTPIVFLTGATTVENRVQSSLSGGNDFVAKPFNLHELSVKALTLILKGSLNID
uniref:Response regulator receiver protein n=1 Tax=uncultured Verrucomicrobiota bacterium TaxID=156588 RepID=D2DXP1_9BACT|nr:response regulator receiver protein [uncultured Verrucomicrobiota bacterium]